MNTMVVCPKCSRYCPIDISKFERKDQVYRCENPGCSVSHFKIFDSKPKLEQKDQDYQFNFSVSLDQNYELDITFYDETRTERAMGTPPTANE